MENTVTQATIFREKGADRKMHRENVNASKKKLQDCSSWHRKGVLTKELASQLILVYRPSDFWSDLNVNAYVFYV